MNKTARDALLRTMNHADHEELRTAISTLCAQLDASDQAAASAEVAYSVASECAPEEGLSSLGCVIDRVDLGIFGISTLVRWPTGQSYPRPACRVSVSFIRPDEPFAAEISAAWERMCGETTWRGPDEMLPGFRRAVMPLLNGFETERLRAAKADGRISDLLADRDQWKEQYEQSVAVRQRYSAELLRILDLFPDLRATSDYDISKDIAPRVARLAESERQLREQLGVRAQECNRYFDELERVATTIGEEPHDALLSPLDYIRGLAAKVKTKLQIDADVTTFLRLGDRLGVGHDLRKNALEALGLSGLSPPYSVGEVVTAILSLAQRLKLAEEAMRRAQGERDGYKDVLRGAVVAAKKAGVES